MGTNLFSKCYQFTKARTAQKAGYYPYFVPIQQGCDTEVWIEGEKKLMVGSNNYLGLTHHPKVLEAADRALRKYGSGCTGSRFLNGTLELHLELESQLAQFMNKEAALVFSTGYQVNLGVISSLIGKKDVAVLDKWDHASVVDGCRLSYGKCFRFQHNNLQSLEKVLKKVQGYEGKLLIVDGVYSMEGDIADLPGILPLAKSYGCQIMVDDAHGIGVLGPNGQGTAAHFDVENQVDLIMGTFSKSFAGVGGFIAGDEAVIHYIQHHARSLIFSASAPPGAVASVLAALEVIQKEPDRRERLLEISQKMKAGFNSLGFNTGDSDSPIIPLIIGDFHKTLQFWKCLFDEGIFCNAALSPAVPPGTERIRTSFIATHTDKQLDFVLDTFERIGKKLAII